MHIKSTTVYELGKKTFHIAIKASFRLLMENSYFRKPNHNRSSLESVEKSNYCRSEQFPKQFIKNHRPMLLPKLPSSKSVNFGFKFLLFFIISPVNS